MPAMASRYRAKATGERNRGGLTVMPNVLTVASEGSPFSSRRHTERSYVPGFRFTKDMVLTPFLSGVHVSLTGLRQYAYWSDSGEVKFIEENETVMSFSSCPRVIVSMNLMLIPGPFPSCPGEYTLPFISAVMKYGRPYGYTCCFTGRETRQ